MQLAVAVASVVVLLVLELVHVRPGRLVDEQQAYDGYVWMAWEWMEQRFVAAEESLVLHALVVGDVKARLSVYHLVLRCHDY